MSIGAAVWLALYWLEQLVIMAHLSPAALWTEGISAAREQLVPMRQQNLDVVVTVVFSLALVLAQL